MVILHSGSGPGRLKNGHFIGSARLISILTLLSRILGLVRDAVCLGFFGARVWHFFLLPFMIPNLFRRLFGEGALSSALIPVYTEQLQKDPQGARLLARSLVTLLIIILSFLTLVGEGILYIYWQFGVGSVKTHLVLSLAAIMLPYMILICTVATLGGILNAHRHFFAPAAAPILLNVCIIGAVVWFRGYFGDDPWEQIFSVAVAILVAGILQLVLQYPFLRREGVSLRPRFVFFDDSLKKVIRLTVPMLVGLSVVQINTLMDYVIASALAGEAAGETFTVWGYTFTYPVVEGANSYLYCANRLYQVPLGIFGIALGTAIFPFLSWHAGRKDYSAFGRTLGQGLRIVIFIALPATVGMIVIRHPLVAAVYERRNFTPGDTLATAWTLLFYSLGIGAYCLQQIVIRAYYSFQDSLTPVKIAVRMVVLNFVLNVILIWPLATGGLALSTALCATIQVIVLLVMLVRRYDIKVTTDLLPSAMKTAAATLVMAVAALGVLYLLRAETSAIQLLVTVSLCGAVFTVASRLLKNEELTALMHRQAPGAGEVEG
ncbi:MAG: murein biosynthesis integral membrane protein MurJ [Sedimentisphaerales bacterium]|nr:murein biosynthesis integral membrane protein MurJ [Sedimentisphaerales bacterium]